MRHPRISDDVRVSYAGITPLMIKQQRTRRPEHRVRCGQPDEHHALAQCFAACGPGKLQRLAAAWRSCCS